MARPFSTLFDRVRTPTGRKALKYTAVSVISVAVSQLAFVFAFGLLHWTARSSAIFATAVGSVPSYFLNRNWVWAKSGRSHLWKEIVPFWVIAFIGMVFSTWSADTAENYVHRHEFSHLAETAIVTGAFFGAFALLWVGKFVIFNKLLFVTKDDDLRDALANEVVG
jgi:putative flippase GtrA